MTTIALIVAGGSGNRFGGAFPKQYVDLDGVPILRRTAQAFISHPAISRVLVVIGPGHDEFYRRACGDLDLLPPVTGGADRQASVHRGLEAVAHLGAQQILIHDGARPFVSRTLIDRVLNGLNGRQAVVPVLPVTDTLRRFADGIAVGEIARDGLYRMQTPQGFDFAMILKAHRAHAGRALTDDAALAAVAGVDVHMTEGDLANVKITTVDDLAARRPDWLTLTGQGFDVHRLVPDRPLWLCGVEIPFELGLAGHSDADVGLHALTDAILGAIGAGDIGVHFPPTDERWRNVDSAIFLARALEMAGEQGGRLVHVDITIIGERPKIGPHRAAILSRLSQLLGLEPDRIGLKATTTEGLGFTGRGEGLAAQAVATLILRNRS
ncbi:bifunctional 2-C-methyl-D-erythritol 4-phosphate cytidylyltransferase/2-C-methyl-D-erythritol 2,4-cyclodiphosphate synthase [Arboricoccus pini]|uniref:bifunctional 2-C-methyl-D-erythritol 4-phosphate cytidylyltransferase/2-C-methyl-D-erythritol 2,4-cyclodiphosphate synthase n=1 Tax=Arboricoccus pini TaxID=1963835 RepID=UPI001FAEDDAC|nr:bifunctional 2-C-methyl-D-erythritol 4-phosphate cytidylyltransferase/2-C-methyl-D-erythritol 2,4-cyclodiphosphate synthase [Arboricoccus pini]